MHRRGVRAENHVFADIEGIAWIPRRMANREVERVEIVIGALDFRTVLDGIAHGDENVFDFFPNDRERMPVPDAPSISG